MAEILEATLTPSKLDLLAEWMGSQRWYAAKGRRPRLTRLRGYRLDDPAGRVGIETIIVQDDACTPSVVYQVPLTYRGAPLPGAESALVGTMEHSVLGTRYVYDAPHDPVYVAALWELIQGRALAQSCAASDTLEPSVTGEAVRGRYAAPPGPVTASRVLAGEQSNTSIVCGVAGVGAVIIKIFRTLAPGPNPDVVLQPALAAAGCSHVARTLGWVTGIWNPDDPSVPPGHLAFAQDFLSGTRDAWRVAVEAVAADAALDGGAEELGAVVAQIHRILAEQFPTARPGVQDRVTVITGMRQRFRAAAAEVPELAELAAAVHRRYDQALQAPWPSLQRIHADLHLGQVIAHPDRGWVVLDFEGEPLRPLAERCQPDLPTRDLAGMLRSFDYAAGTHVLEHPDADPDRARAWARRQQAQFLAGYRAAQAADSEYPELLYALLLDKALYEVLYEARNRPDWLPIPLQAVRELVAEGARAAYSEDEATTPDPDGVPETLSADAPRDDADSRPDAHDPAPADSAPADPEDPPLDRRTVMEPVPTAALVADYSAVDAFLEGRHSQPHDLLGHHLGPGGLTITCYRPMADSVRARLADGTLLDLPHVKGGIWSGTTPEINHSQDYRLLVNYGDGIDHEQDDPYRFAPTLGEIDRHLFNEGRHEQLWKVLGSHVQTYPGPLGEVRGVSFAVWAPNANAVHVVGDFNGWDQLSHPMRNLQPSGVWELFLPGAAEGMNYQFLIRGQDGIARLKADPMAQYAEVAPKQASIVWESTYEWGDQEWMAVRAERDVHHGPMSIYEVHLGSWRQGQNYAELAEHLVNYVKDLGFTHVEFLPVMEHPYVPSWGYHVTGYYAVSSRWGTPDEFRLLVDYLHRNGIGVILDWVPGHFATDPWALAKFDGQALYEHPDPRKGWHNEWGSYIFDFARKEVRNFLVANATYWLEEFHVDGLRVDGVASMLYLDYSRQPGQWIPNEHGGRENLDAVALLQEANATAYKRTPGVVTIAEESTSWSGVSHPTSMGGLGFGFKWNMGWMNDALRYVGTDPIYRQYQHNKLTFALMYAYSENFVLPISHDEVVHGKGSLMRKSRGNRDDQVATVRAFLAYMWTQPGKQLLFMGCEFGQESEWSDGRSLDWWLLDQPLHYRIHAQVKEMNAIYRANPALWALDHDPAGFRWLNADNAAANTFSYLRFGDEERGAEGPVVAVVVNFSGQTHEPYRIGLPRGGRWRVVLDTAGFHPDAPSSAGLVIEADDEGWDEQPYAANVTVARLSTVWLIPED